MVIRELKNRIGEYHDYHGWLTEEQIWALRSSNSWQILPINFQKRHRQMLEWTYTLLSKRFIKIHPSLLELIVSLSKSLRSLWTSITFSIYASYRKETYIHIVANVLALRRGSNDTSRLSGNK
ncbi:MAG: hypothetical protein WBL67_21745 [Nitrososphaeraceae archaeon]